MATIVLESVEIFGSGVLEAEGVVIDREGNAWGGGRNGVVYKVSPDGVVHEVAQLPDRAIPNGVTLARFGISRIATRQRQRLLLHRRFCGD